MRNVNFEFFFHFNYGIKIKAFPRKQIGPLLFIMNEAKMTRLYLVRAIVSPDMGEIWFWLYEYVSLCARAYVCAEAQAPKIR